MTSPRPYNLQVVDRALALGSFAMLCDLAFCLNFCVE